MNLYNGKDKFPEEKVLRLYDAFKETPEHKEITGNHGDGVCIHGRHVAALSIAELNISVTRRYLGVTRDDTDEVYMGLELTA